MIVTTTDRGIRAALALQAAGVEVAALADLRRAPSRAAGRLAANGIEALHGWTIVAARGRTAVDGAILAPLERPQRGRDRRSRRATSNATCWSSPAATRRRPHCSPRRARRRSTTTRAATSASSELPPGHLGRRSARGRGPLEHRARVRRARRARGRAALGLAQDRRRQPPRRAARAGEGRTRRGRRAPGRCRRGLRAARRSPASARTSAPRTSAAAIKEGYDSIELCKRFTTVTMGPCQGRMCQLPSARLIAQETGQSSRRSGRRRPARRGRRCRWRRSRAGRSSRPSARRSTAATASSARRSCGPATGVAPTTTATPRARRWRCTSRPG